ncbi:hypothetical protein LI951_14295 [Enterococcus sp. BWT-B8]|uniref:hypothetical protein n=1 Tax=Enterococcus sp. BWT-B8 TaxID=2885157 RepID=UPI001E357A1D|nr:hypothetical protein [Enterococcus sp. BWT-B8]MCB5953243.1 hypothetical protein [Enterococcus sp. BWT-B8]
MKKIVFSKYSNERARRFAVRTDIMSDDSGKLTVYKKNLYPEGQQHIEDIYNWYQKLQDIYKDTSIALNHCDYLGDRVALEYLSQYTLEHELNQLLRKRNLAQFSERLFSYINEVKKGKMTQPFVKTPEFIETFGDVELGEALSAEVTNIDMVLNNALCGEKWTMIDYEWTFDFPVPANFVIYRILHYFINSSPYRGQLDNMDLFEKVDISLEERVVFAKMEQHFQTHFLLSDRKQEKLIVPIRELHDEISPGSIDLKHVYNAEKKKQETPIQLFMSSDYSFSEENSMVVIRNIDNRVVIDLQLNLDTEFLRVDPLEHACLVTDFEIRDENGERLAILNTNGALIKDNQLIFIADDPQIIIGGLREKKAVNISFQVKEVFDHSKYMFESILSERQLFERKIDELNQSVAHLNKEKSNYETEISVMGDELAHQKQVITNMENTKIWKAYEKYKKTFKKG